MKLNGFRFVIILYSMLIYTGCGPAPNDPHQWTDEELTQWFHEKEWLGGWDVLPDSSVDQKAFAIQYFNHPARWDMAFSYLKNTDLSKVEPGTYELDSTDLFVIAQEYMAKNEEDTKYEAHKKYADIQYLVRGTEKIGVASLESTSVLTPYNETKDIGFYSVSEDRYRLASFDNFFILLPEDAHRPCVTTGSDTLVKKIVIKVRID